MSEPTFDRATLDGKDRDQLQAIASAIGVKGVSRLKKADLVAAIVGSAPAAPSTPSMATVRAVSTAASRVNSARSDGSAGASMSRARNAPRPRTMRASPRSGGSPRRCAASASTGSAMLSKPSRQAIARRPSGVLAAESRSAAWRRVSTRAGYLRRRAGTASCYCTRQRFVTGHDGFPRSRE